MKVVVFTLGCKVNACESQALIKGFFDMGYEVSEELSFADVYVINTCAVTKEAEKKSRQAVARVKKFNKNAKIIVTGCASQRDADSFLGKDGVFLVTGTSSKEKILQLLSDSGNRVFEMETCYHELPIPKTTKARAFIKVQDGCNNFCSYCIIPYLRGRSRSRNPDSVKLEIETLNPLEAVLTAINLSAYKFENVDLAGLISALKGVKTRIRLGSLEENVITQEFLTALSSLYDFAPHFHLSLQSGSNSTLKAMRRKYDTDSFFEGVKLIRKYFPNAGITTDVIVGYPTETEEDFIDSLTFVKKVEFSDIHVFNYSPREGTLSYKLKDLPPSVKKDRLNRMLALKDELKSSFISKNLGVEHQVIVEEYDGNYSVGYTANYIKVYIDKKIKEGKYSVILTSSYLDGALASIKE